MTVGTIVHELLQKCLRNKLNDMADIVAVGREFLNSKDMARMLYACKMSRVEAAKEVEQFYSRIHDFIKNHVHVSYEVSRMNARSPASQRLKIDLISCFNIIM